MNDTGNVTKDGEEDVDQEIRAATALEEDTERWEDDGKDDLADVADNDPVLVNRQALILVSAVLCLKHKAPGLCRRMELQHGFFGSGESSLPGCERHFDDLYSVENGIDCEFMIFGVKSEAGTCVYCL